MAAANYVLVVDDDSVLVFRLPSLSGLDLQLESTITRHKRVWLVRTRQGDFVDDNLRGAVAEALNLFRDSDRGPSDPANLAWEARQQRRVALSREAKAPSSPPHGR